MEEFLKRAVKYVNMEDSLVESVHHEAKNDANS